MAMSVTPKQKFNLCRLCLCAGHRLLDVFSGSCIRDFSVEETINDLLTFKAVENPDFPWLVCSTCMTKLTEFRLFKQRCLECKMVFESRFLGMESRIKEEEVDNIKGYGGKSVRDASVQTDEEEVTRHKSPLFDAPLDILSHYAVPLDEEEARADYEHLTSEFADETEDEPRPKIPRIESVGSLPTPPCEDAIKLEELDLVDVNQTDEEKEDFTVEDENVPSEKECSGNVDETASDKMWCVAEFFPHRGHHKMSVETIPSSWVEDNGKKLYAFYPPTTFTHAAVRRAVRNCESPKEGWDRLELRFRTGEFDVLLDARALEAEVENCCDTDLETLTSNFAKASSKRRRKPKKVLYPDELSDCGPMERDPVMQLLPSLPVPPVALPTKFGAAKVVSARECIPLGTHQEKKHPGKAVMVGARQVKAGHAMPDVHGLFGSVVTSRQTGRIEIVGRGKNTYLSRKNLNVILPRSPAASQISKKTVPESGNRRLDCRAILPGAAEVLSIRKVNPCRRDIYSTPGVHGTSTKVVPSSPGEVAENVSEPRSPDNYPQVSKLLSVDEDSDVGFKDVMAAIRGLKGHISVENAAILDKIESLSNGIENLLLQRSTSVIHSDANFLSLHVLPATSPEELKSVELEVESNVEYRNFLVPVKMEAADNTDENLTNEGGKDVTVEDKNDPCENDQNMDENALAEVPVKMEEAYMTEGNPNNEEEKDFAIEEENVPCDNECSGNMGENAMDEIAKMEAADVSDEVNEITKEEEQYDFTYDDGFVPNDDEDSDNTKGNAPHQDSEVNTTREPVTPVNGEWRSHQPLIQPTLCPQRPAMGMIPCRMEGSIQLTVSPMEIEPNLSATDGQTNFTPSHISQTVGENDEPCLEPPLTSVTSAYKGSNKQGVDFDGRSSGADISSDNVSGVLHTLEQKFGINCIRNISGAVPAGGLSNVMDGQTSFESNFGSSLGPNVALNDVPSAGTSCATNGEHYVAAPSLRDGVAPGTSKDCAVVAGVDAGPCDLNSCASSPAVAQSPEMNVAPNVGTCAAPPLGTSFAPLVETNTAQPRGIKVTTLGGKDISVYLGSNLVPPIKMERKIAPKVGSNVSSSTGIDLGSHATMSVGPSANTNFTHPDSNHVIPPYSNTNFAPLVGKNIYLPVAANSTPLIRVKVPPCVSKNVSSLIRTDSAPTVDATTMLIIRPNVPQPFVTNFPSPDVTNAAHPNVKPVVGTCIGVNITPLVDINHAPCLSTKVAPTFNKNSTLLILPNIATTDGANISPHVAANVVAPSGGNNVASPVPVVGKEVSDSNLDQNVGLSSQVATALSQPNVDICSLSITEKDRLLRDLEDEVRRVRLAMLIEDMETNQQSKRCTKQKSNCQNPKDPVTDVKTSHQNNPQTKNSDSQEPTGMNSTITKGLGTAATHGIKLLSRLKKDLMASETGRENLKFMMSKESTDISKEKETTSQRQVGLAEDRSSSAKEVDDGARVDNLPSLHADAAKIPINLAPSQISPEPEIIDLSEESAEEGISGNASHLSEVGSDAEASFNTGPSQSLSAEATSCPSILSMLLKKPPKPVVVDLSDDKEVNTGVGKSGKIASLLKPAQNVIHPQGAVLVNPKNLPIGAKSKIILVPVSAYNAMQKNKMPCTLTLKPAVASKIIKPTTSASAPDPQDAPYSSLMFQDEIDSIEREKDLMSPQVLRKLLSLVSEYEYGNLRARKDKERMRKMNGEATQGNSNGALDVAPSPTQVKSVFDESMTVSEKRALLRQSAAEARRLRYVLLTSSNKMTPRKLELRQNKYGKLLDLPLSERRRIVTNREKEVRQMEKDLAGKPEGVVRPMTRWNLEFEDRRIKIRAEVAALKKLARLVLIQQQKLRELEAEKKNCPSVTQDGKLIGLSKLQEERNRQKKVVTEEQQTTMLEKITAILGSFRPLSGETDPFRVRQEGGLITYRAKKKVGVKAGAHNQPLAQETDPLSLEYGERISVNIEEGLDEGGVEIVEIPEEEDKFKENVVVVPITQDETLAGENDPLSIEWGESVSLGNEHDKVGTGIMNVSDDQNQSTLNVVEHASTHNQALSEVSDSLATEQEEDMLSENSGEEDDEGDSEMMEVLEEGNHLKENVGEGNHLKENVEEVPVSQTQALSGETDRLVSKQEGSVFRGENQEEGGPGMAKASGELTKLKGNVVENIKTWNQTIDDETDPLSTVWEEQMSENSADEGRTSLEESEEQIQIEGNIKEVPVALTQVMSGEADLQVTEHEDRVSVDPGDERDESDTGMMEVSEEQAYLKESVEEVLIAQTQSLSEETDPLSLEWGD